jgi:hypothetical protein
MRRAWHKRFNGSVQMLEAVQSAGLAAACAVISWLWPSSLGQQCWLRGSRQAPAGVLGPPDFYAEAASALRLRIASMHWRALHCLQKTWTRPRMPRLLLVPNNPG